jgi:hypothetical protein
MAFILIAVIYIVIINAVYRLGQAIVDVRKDMKT